MTVSNIQRILKSSEVEGGGLAVVVGSTNASVVRSPEEEARGGGGAPEEDSTLRRLELPLIGAAICQRKVVPIGAII